MALSQDTFRASIPPQSIGTDVYYYVSARSNSGRTVTKPLTAPQGYIKFRVDNPTSIGNELHSPEEFSLSQNYPNPFNPQTIIEFTLVAKANTNLIIYDALGREVAVLVNELRDAGQHKVVFDATGISAGVYFYKLSANGTSKVRRMILVK
jgi:hypothetical protein